MEWSKCFDWQGPDGTCTLPASQLKRPNLFHGIPTETRSLERSQCAPTLSSISSLLIGLTSDNYWTGLHGSAADPLRHSPRNVNTRTVWTKLQGCTRNGTEHILHIFGCTDRFPRTGTDYLKEMNGMDRNGFPNGTERNRIPRKIMNL